MVAVVAETTKEAATEDPKVDYVVPENDGTEFAVENKGCVAPRRGL